MGNRAGNLSLGNWRKNCKDNIKMGITEIGVEDGKWLELAKGVVQRRACISVVLEFRVCCL